MYFNSTLSLTPSSETITHRKKPSKIFARLLHDLTGGLTSPAEVHQTFTAIAILQDLNRCFRSLQINNIIRLAKDGYDYYLDEEGKEDDLAEAMKSFKLNNDEFASELFNDLYLVLEHDDKNLRYLIEVDIKRCHNPKSSPIVIKINGLIKEFATQDGEDETALSERMSGLFTDKSKYQAFINEKRAYFDAFTARLEQTIRSTMAIKDAQHKNQNCLLRPQKSTTRSGASVSVTHREEMALAHRGYAGYDNYAAYTWMWCGLAFAYGVSANDVHVVNESGEALHHIGEEGSVADDDWLNPDVDYNELLTSDTLSSGDSLSSFDDAGSWLDFSSSDSSSSCGSSCGSSCSSCSSD